MPLRRISVNFLWLVPVSVLLWFSPVFAATPVQDIPLTQELGPYAAGFRVVEQYDNSRTFKTDEDDQGKPQARPLQTLIWYPATRIKEPEMTFADYVQLVVREVNFDLPPAEEVQPGLFGDAFKPAYAEKMQTYRDAEPAPGRFPVIIYAPSFSSFSWENVDLCRYLASYGYVVMASPGMGVGRESTHDMAGVDAQARDITFLIEYAAQLENTDSSKVAVAGFSWGGLSALFAAARDERVKALVAMDGSFRYFPWLVAGSNEVKPEAMQIPLMFFKGQWTLEDQAHEYKDEHSDLLRPNVLNAWTHGDLFNVQMLGLAHPEFNTATHRWEDFWKNEFPRLQQADYDRAEGRMGYSWVARYTLEFLDAYLNEDTKARAFLMAAPRDNGVPPHTMAMKFRQAAP